MAKETSPQVSSLAAKVLQGYVPTPEETRTLAASCLSQDESPKPKADEPAEEADDS